MDVSEAAHKYVRVRSPGGGHASWDPTVTPYIVEPMNMLRSRRHEAVIFAGPARTGKTQGLVDGWVGHMVKCDPSDMAIIQTSMETARDYSKMRIGRMFRSSPELKAELRGRKSDDNTYDKWLRAGVVLKLGWPSISQLSGKDFKYVALTDYDRMPEDIDKEGSPFALGQKRTQTFLSRGMTLAESSPGYEITDPNWKPSTLHEAPPTRGILALYNQGDRRRMYWRCPHCGEYFMLRPGVEAFNYNQSEDLFGVTDSQIAGDITAICTTSGCEIAESHKQKMNAMAIWVPDGCHIEREGDEYGLVGDPRDVKIASFWMHGIAAAYQNWTSIIQRWLNAQRQYDLTGDEEPLKNTVNLDQGSAYMARHLAEETERDNIDRRVEKIERYTVPRGVRTIVAAVDVQAGKNARFVVQVHGVGAHREKWLIDRYDIKQSAREIDGEQQQCNPAKYSEDWALITDKVINSTYKLANGTEMRVYRTAVDTGGAEGVQDRAYDWWRGLKSQRNGLHDRVVLIKGGSSYDAPKVKVKYPDSTARSDRRSNARGDVPVLMINTDKIKDVLSNDLARDIIGPGYIHFPDWLGDDFFAELKAERRNLKGRWEKVSTRNEAWDLLVYLDAVLYYLEYERINWATPPLWAEDHERNSEIMSKEQRQIMKAPRPGVSTGADDWISGDEDWF
jgi:phage terminase large subunit GpA-like protein